MYVLLIKIINIQEKTTFFVFLGKKINLFDQVTNEICSTDLQQLTDPTYCHRFMFEGGSLAQLKQEAAKHVRAHQTVILKIVTK